MTLHPVRQRLDKATANVASTIHATLRNVLENISVDDLFAPRSDFVVRGPPPSSAADETPRPDLQGGPLDPAAADSAKGDQRVFRGRASQKRPHEPGDEGADGTAHRGGVQTRGKAKRRSRE